MHISTRLILGGSQENTVLSCEGQADRGHEVSLVYGPIYGPEGSLLERVHTHGGISTIEAEHLIREMNPYRDWRCYIGLRKLIRQWRPDVVHTHSSKAGVLGRVAAWKENVPCVVHTIHGLPFHRYQSKWRNAVYIQAERFAAKRCHKIITVADAMREQALAAGVGRREQYVTVYSGMEVEQFLEPVVSRTHIRDELGVASDDFVLGTVARLAELKGHDDLLDSLGEMMRENNTLKLLWIGDGWWRDRLLQRVKGMGLADQVIVTGLVSPEEIPKYMQAMDALAHPSYREGLPRAVTQALLCGVPVVVYDVDGGREVCVDGETGLLLPPGALEELKTAVQWMIEHPAERAEMGARGRAMCAKRFSTEQMIDDLETVYESVLVSGEGALAETQ